MYKDKKISVSIPAYFEEKLISETISSIPDYVDHIVVVNDGSTDNTAEEVKKVMKKDKRVFLIDSEINEGIGASIMKAHKKGIEYGADILVVMAGDNQMDPNELPKLLDKIVDENADYAKGNRFFHTQDLNTMPRFRLFVNVVVSFLVKFCTGYWSVADPLNGYTALKAGTFQDLDVNSISKRYDFEVSMFVQLSLIGAKIKDVAIPARYGRAVSTIRLHKEAPRAIRVLIKGFFKRMIIRYTLFSFHPIALFYGMSCLAITWTVLWTVVVSIITFARQTTPTTAVVMLSVLPFIVSFELLLQAVTLDIYNEPK